MAIKKTDVAKLQYTKLNQEIKKLEAEIDETIKEQFEYQQFAIYELKAGITDTILERVMDNYEQAGWTVRYNNKRDNIGRHLVFK